MKNLLIVLSLLFATYCHAQDIPAPADPCQKIDTLKLREMIIGTWVDMKDSTHFMTITPDSVEETIIVVVSHNTFHNNSYWNYNITDNIFSSDDVTCYSIREFKAGFGHHVDLSINSIDDNYMLTGGEGKRVFKKKK